MSRQLHEYDRNMRDYLIGRYVDWYNIALRIDEVLMGDFYQDHRKLFFWRQRQFGVQPLPAELTLGCLENARAHRQALAAPAPQSSYTDRTDQMVPWITPHSIDQRDQFAGSSLAYQRPLTSRYRYATPHVRRGDSRERLRPLETDARLRRERRECERTRVEQQEVMHEEVRRRETERRHRRDTGGLSTD